MTGYDYRAMAAALDRLAAVPDEVLSEVVARDGLCFWAFDRAAMPVLSGEGPADRELAASMCAGCPVIDTDRRVLYPVWARRRGGEAR
jgi:WhiB family redox-sensing transcriptional regulator